MQWSPYFEAYLSIFMKFEFCNGIIHQRDVHIITFCCLCDVLARRTFLIFMLGLPSSNICASDQFSLIIQVNCFYSLRRLALPHNTMARIAQDEHDARYENTMFSQVYSTVMCTKIRVIKGYIHQYNWIIKRHSMAYKLVLYCVCLRLI